jgi:hypothetical protein
MKHLCSLEPSVSPVLESVPETSRLRVALEDFQLNLCTSRDVPSGCGEGSNSRPSDPDGSKPPGHFPKLKGQKAIGDFFARTVHPNGSSSGERIESISGEGEGSAGNRYCQADYELTLKLSCHTSAREPAPQSSIYHCI